MTYSPIVYQWDGEVMKPMARYDKRCAQEYVIGDFYQLENVEERSKASHDQYFARLDELHGTLHEDLRMEFPTREHLRKAALIHTGFHKEQKYVLASHQGAMKLAADMGEDDEFAVVTVTGCVVTKYVAKTQRTRGKEAMDKKDFQASKTAVLDWVDALLARYRTDAPPTAPDTQGERAEEKVKA